jgi:hypothetical protein
MLPQLTDPNSIATVITAVGALGVASMGVVETLGKALLVYDTKGARQRQSVAGLPYAGYGSVKRLVRRVGPALQVAYGDQYTSIIVEQYRNGRASGQCPETIRQGVRLGLPYLSAGQAESVIAVVWGLEKALSHDFAVTLTARTVRSGDATAADGSPPAAGATPPASSSGGSPEPQALAARFATALDTSVEAAFASAEATYQAWVRFWAGFAAVAMAVAFYAAQPDIAQNWKHLAYWFPPVLVGLVAVPLAPAAKDLATGVSNALTALGQIRGKAAS